MLSVARAQRSCPQCRHHLLSLFENGFASARAESRSLTRPATLNGRTFRAGRNCARPFSTSSRRLQDIQPEPNSSEPNVPPPEADDIETTVRQAKQQFGDTLPKGYLNEEEYKLYERLYGAPLRETRAEDVGMPIPDNLIEETLDDDPSQKILLRRNEDGTIEELVYEAAESLPSPPSETSAIPTEAAVEVSASDVDGAQGLPSEAGMYYINAVAKNEREYNALLKLQKDFENASLRATEEEDIDEEEQREEEEDVDEEEEEEEEEGEPDAEFEPTERVHEHTKIGQWRTRPTTLQLPKADFVDPIAQLLNRTDIKHVAQAAEKALGGPGLPFSTSTPLKRNGEQKGITLEAGSHKMSEIEADAYIATLLPGLYSSTMSILVEIRKRLGSEWIAKLLARNNGEGPRVLDLGAGGAGLAAWEQVQQTEWDIVREGKRMSLIPPGKKTTVIGSETLRHRVSRFLHNTTFLPRLPDYLHSGDHPQKLEGGETPLARKQFDIIICSHQLMPLKEGYKRKELLDNLWEMLSPEGGILIFLEKGHPRGFEAVADVRSRLLNEFIVAPSSDPRPEPIEPENRREREQGMIVAPCTNHKQCPMYLTPGLNLGRKDFCHFSQRFTRPPFLQKVLGATHRNHEDIEFSFVAIQRGIQPGLEKMVVPEQGKNAADNAFAGYANSAEAPDPLSLPRNILPPLKRRGHVTLDLCTPDATIERWTVPRSFSKQAYHDARKARWGDLWALGAKTRVPRPVRLGKGGPVPNDGGVRARRAMQSSRPKVVNLDADSGGIYSAKELGKKDRGERRMKGRNNPKRMKSLMDELK
ncbi:Rsm22-domain-containing protein [Xylariaceae sp. FL0016]|nr:Rsm22-domain-containing protein [Xylariaceae sp. FL0016]